MTTYKDVQRILLDNGIPHYVKKYVGNEAETIAGIEIYEIGILLNQKEQLIKNLLAGEQVKIHSSNETVNITI